MAEKKITRVESSSEASKKAAASAKPAAVAKTTAPKKTTKAEAAPAEKKPAKAETKPAAATQAKPAEGKPTGLRIGAIALWVVAIAFEVLAILILFGKITLTFIPTLAQIIIALVLDLACVSAGSTLWKKANHIDPASESNKVKFWLWNNLGVIVTAFAFIPFVILALTNKNADKKTKTIAIVVAAIALLIGGLVSYDWNPVSQEGMNSAISTLGDQDVYWTKFGKVYHTHDDCGHLNNSDELFTGTVEAAMENNKPRICKDCAKKDNIEIGENGAISSDKSADSADNGDEFELDVFEGEEETQVDEAA